MQFATSISPGKVITFGDGGGKTERYQAEVHCLSGSWFFFTFVVFFVSNLNYNIDGFFNIVSLVLESQNANLHANLLFTFLVCISLFACPFSLFLSVCFSVSLCLCLLLSLHIILQNKIYRKRHNASLRYYIWNPNNINFDIHIMSPMTSI